MSLRENKQLLLLESLEHEHYRAWMFAAAMRSPTADTSRRHACREVVERILFGRFCRIAARVDDIIDGQDGGAIR